MNIIKKTGGAVLLLLFIAVAGNAQPYVVGEGVSIRFDTPPPPWIVTLDPPSELVKEVEHHVNEGARRKGKQLTSDQIRELAAKRLAQEELFLVNPETQSRLLISFDEIQENQALPDKESVELSARYAAQGVADEGWEEVDVRTSQIQITGAAFSTRFDVTYTLDGAKIGFYGVVGYSGRHWFWLYFSDFSQGYKDREVFNDFLEGLRIDRP